MRFERAATLAWLRGSPTIPVLIVGGGINGAGVLRELALNGIDALLVERSDFASGATGASSRMIHGGLRYLEYGEFRLVREALRERNRLLRNAPHCVHPLATTIPLFTRVSGFTNSLRRLLRLGGKPAQRGAWLVRFGLGLYQMFAGRKSPLPRHRIDTAAAARQLRPAIHPGIIATATYYDAWNPQPERLCLEVIGDALKAHAGCRALNYCRMRRADGPTVELGDEVTKETLQVRPQVLVNATGAWIDAVNGKIGPPTRYMGGTKGSHLVVDHSELHAQTCGGELFYENADGRICLFLPLHGRVLVGTTDIPVDNPDAAVCEADEYDYLVAAVRQVFPTIKIRPENVVSRFCGVRPLPRSKASHPGAVSRDHECRILEPDAQHTFPVLCLIGGKWTTFRAFAEQAADRLFARLGRTRTADSKQTAIGGGHNYPKDETGKQAWIRRLAHSHNLPEAVAARLFGRYGTAAADTAAHIAAGAAGARESVAGYLAGELAWLMQREAVVHLDDLLLRRTTLALYERLDRATLKRLVHLCGQTLGWTSNRQTEETKRTLALLAQRHGVRIPGADDPENL